MPPSPSVALGSASEIACITDITDDSSQSDSGIAEISVESDDDCDIYSDEGSQNDEVANKDSEDKPLVNESTVSVDSRPRRQAVVNALAKQEQLRSEERNLNQVLRIGRSVLNSNAAVRVNAECAVCLAGTGGRLKSAEQKERERQREAELQQRLLRRQQRARQRDEDNDAFEPGDEKSSKRDRRAGGGEAFFLSKVWRNGLFCCVF